jgi:hypothetical protein
MNAAMGEVQDYVGATGEETVLSFARPSRKAEVACVAKMVQIEKSKLVEAGVQSPARTQKIRVAVVAMLAKSTASFVLIG